jgi:hypothetical protein
MAIAFDAAYNGDLGVDGSSLTYSHTCTGTDRILFVEGIVYQNGTTPTGDVLTGITYNSVAMTLISKQLITGSYPRYSYLYYLVNPASGTNDVVVSLSVSNMRPQASSVSYTGVLQTSPIGATNEKTTNNVTSQELSTTTTAANSWVISAGRFILYEMNASTGVTKRTGATAQNSVIGDSGGPIATPGAYSMTWTASSATPMAVHQAEFKPAPDIGGYIFQSY